MQELRKQRKNNAKIRDDIAVEIVEKLDYDFSKADSDKAMESGVIARTIVLDSMVEKYLNEHPDTIVINIGCGLDTRCYRMKRKYISWYNVDLPETIEIRGRFLEEKGQFIRLQSLQWIFLTQAALHIMEIMCL